MSVEPQYSMKIWFIFIFSHAILSLYLAEIDESFRQKAKETYDRVLSCIKLGREQESFINKSAFEFPLDAEEHYQELLNKTSHFRPGQSHWHLYANYHGSFSMFTNVL